MLSVNLIVKESPLLFHVLISTLYTKIPYDKLSKVLHESTDFCFKGGCITASGNISLKLFRAPLETIELLTY